MDKNKIVILVLSVALVISIAIIGCLLTKDTNTVYTISFNTNGGNEVVTQNVEEGKKISKPINPSKEGYEFLGWYLNGEYFDFETKVEGNLTLEAKWKEIVVEENKTEDIVEEENKEENEEKNEETTTKYTVTFNSDGGTTVAKQTVEKGKKATEPKAPTKSGYTFKGWYLGTTKYNFSNKVTKNITLKAKWEKVQEEKPNTEPEQTKEYTVKFDVDGKIVSTKTVKEGEKVSKPSTPTKEGYTFKYWTLNGTEYDFAKAITGDITLKVEWKKNDVISYEEVVVENSVANQVKIYVTLNGRRVAGTVEMTSTSGKKVTVEVPATGVIKTKGTYSSISNPKVK